jgi:hypothetical protein
MHEVDAVERVAKAYLADCGDQPINFNQEKALRTLRACAIKMFELEANYYFSLDSPDPSWLDDIENEVVKSLSGLISDGLAAFQDSIRIELWSTIQQHRQRWKPNSTGSSPGSSSNPASATKPQRLSATVECPKAARRMEAFCAEKGIGQKQFAAMAKTTDRTLRTFRHSGKVRHDTFGGIAEAMGLTKEELLGS